MVNVRVMQEKDLPLPQYQTKGSAGMDVYSAESLILKAGAIQIVSTGLRMAVPEGYELHVRPRSGLAFKHGISLVNTPGTLDSDYRGELKLIMINHGKEDLEIKKGDRVAQIILNKYEPIEWEEVDKLDETERGHGRFGSTGL